MSDNYCIGCDSPLDADYDDLDGCLCAVCEAEPEDCTRCGREIAEKTVCGDPTCACPTCDVPCARCRAERALETLVREKHELSLRELRETCHRTG